MTIRVVAPMTREALPADEVGELGVAGYLTPGYYRALELDAAALTRAAGSILGAAPAFGGVGTDQIALHVREAAQDGNHQAPGAGSGVGPRLGATHLSKTRPKWS